MYRERNVGDGLPADLDPQAFYTVQYMHVNDPFPFGRLSCSAAGTQRPGTPPRENKMVRKSP